MTQNALGLIEVIGMTAALEAADTCLKSSNVQLIGYEKVTGGLVTVKIDGDVGAVKAAIVAAKVRAEKINTVVSTLVIPRPAKGIQPLIQLERPLEIAVVPIREEEALVPDLAEQESAVTSHEAVEEVEEGPEQQDILILENQEDKADDEADTRVDQADTWNDQADSLIDQTEPLIEKKKKNVCNLCGDPECPREKGMPHGLCIHYEDDKK